MAALNTARTPLIVARAKRILLSTVGATQILQYTARKTMLLKVQPYVVIKVAGTVLTLAVAWTDPDAGADTFNWYNAINVPVGISLQQEVLLLAKGGTTVTITGTAGTINQATLSAFIEEAE